MTIGSETCKDAGDLMDRRVVEAKEACAVARADEYPLIVSIGDLYWSDDPLVRKYPQLFRDLMVKSTMPQKTTPQVETATAAPGERRDIQHSPTDTAKLPPARVRKPT